MGVEGATHQDPGQDPTAEDKRPQQRSRGNPQAGEIQPSELDG